MDAKRYAARLAEAPPGNFDIFVDGVPTDGLHPLGYRFAHCPCDLCVSAWRARCGLSAGAMLYTPHGPVGL